MSPYLLFSCSTTSRGALLATFFFFKQKTAYEIGLGIPAEPLFRSVLRVANCDGHTVTIRPRILQAIYLAPIPNPTTKIRVNATGRKFRHKGHGMEMKTAISCPIFSHKKILMPVGVEIISLATLRS